MSIKTIAVLGQGQMGSGITQHAAACGYEVLLYGRNPEKVAKAVNRIEKSYGRNVEKGRMTEEDKAAAMANIRTTSRLEDVKGCDIVIEAVAEDLELKKDFFRQLDKICKPETILATNTSSMSISAIAEATNRGDKIIGMHFFSPVPIMKLVEIILCPSTSDATYETVRELCDGLKKVSVKILKDTPGFIVNRVLFAYFLECIHIYEEGIASKEDIDLAIKNGLNHPMGPFNLMDMGGLDTFPHVCETLQAIDKDRFACPKSVKKLAAEGKYGMKTGEGWYTYNK
ncbi:MAG TPA: 3-hydroxyacyl-CoA dehydrogenase family protein [Clostridiales bacterium]|nr:3-hydroxyacyl-CoA dehydrogenase family protein [Clostridiales bacterium]